MANVKKNLKSENRKKRKKGRTRKNKCTKKEGWVLLITLYHIA